MPRYMLDTDTCSHIMKRSQPLVLERLLTLPVTDVCISVITKAELLYGVEVSPKRAQDEAALAASCRTWRSCHRTRTRRHTTRRFERTSRGADP